MSCPVLLGGQNATESSAGSRILAVQAQDDVVLITGQRVVATSCRCICAAEQIRDVAPAESLYFDAGITSCRWRGFLFLHARPGLERIHFCARAA